NRTHVIERGRERHFARLFAEDDLHQHYALDWRKEMDADEISWPSRHLRERGDRLGRRVGAEDCPSPIAASAAAIAPALILRSSNTASTTRLQSLSAP